MRKIYGVKLNSEERSELERVVNKGKAPRGSGARALN
jgi:hypothetical protein